MILGQVKVVSKILTHISIQASSPRTKESETGPGTLTAQSALARSERKENNYSSPQRLIAALPVLF